MMKKNKIIYWSFLGIVLSIMLWSAFNFAFNDAYKDGFRHLGLPDWFRGELTIAKILGSLVLLIPLRIRLPSWVREFAFFGFMLVLVSANIAHIAVGDNNWYILSHLIILGLLLLSYVYYHKLLKTA